jgi:PAS domain S-box-containing protein
MNTSVLVVDDSLTIRMDLTEALIGAGLNAVPCSTVAEARGALAQEQFSLIILDVLLPDGDGVELLKEIRGTPSHKGTAVMLLSTEAEVRDRVRGLTTGADEYIGKPYDTNYIVARARELLRRGQPVTAPPQTTILVIDDSATFREELRHALEAASYRVLTASTGDEGLRVAAHARPTAIIVDGMLPGIDGATVVRHIRLDTALRRTPCLLLTASEDRGAEVHALDAGADAFVRKGEDVAIVLARLGAVLRSAGTQMGNENTASLMGPKKILVVDDSQTYLHEISGALRGEGYEVALAHSGEEALELLAVQPVDCILLDLLMPGLGGQETCLRIKSAPGMRDIPLVMVTALEDRQTVIQGLSAGADDFIAKSSDFQVLKARVHAQIRRKQFEDENRRTREELLKKELQVAFLESEERFRILVEGVQDYAILMLDPHGNVASWNAGAERIKGYRADEIIGQNFSRFYPQEDIDQGKPEEELQIAAASGRSETECWRVRKDGSRFWANLVITAVRNSSGSLLGFSEISRDISERKRSEEHLVKKVAELKRSNDELQQFAYVASHDLQEPLRMVASYTQLLANRYKGRLDSDADEFIAYAVEGSTRMQGLIQDLLAYSRAGTNGKALREISSENALKEALTNLRAAIEESGAVVTHDSLPDITMDDTQLAQVFQNLVGNAIKYRSAEVPNVHVSATKNGGKEWIFSVRDNGLGIDPQYFERIFILFQRLHGQTEFAGTGIGLAICKKILERLGGRIWVESQPEKGSTFHFALPERDGK